MSILALRQRQPAISSTRSTSPRQSTAESPESPTDTFQFSRATSRAAMGLMVAASICTGAARAEASSMSFQPVTVEAQASLANLHQVGYVYTDIFGVQRETTDGIHAGAPVYTDVFGQQRVMDNGLKAGTPVHSDLFGVLRTERPADSSQNPPHPTDKETTFH